VKLKALRGATTVEDNVPEAILEATEELVRAVMERNSLDADRMVSCIFTCTEDLDAEFPAVAARRLGLDDVPLLCAQEIAVPGALPRVIRLLLHCYADEDARLQHVYLRDAVALRRDLEGAQ
jgi:chorismate mutase